MSTEPEDLAKEPPAQDDRAATRVGRSRLTVVLYALAALLVLALAIAWISRERIADNLISSELGKRGIPASYQIESIGPREQVLSNLVIGDPKRPDFTAERIVVSIRQRLGVPGIGAVRLVRPRLYGTFLKGELSFGALDPLIFTDSGEPFRLPDIDLTIEDGRGLIESDYSAAGLKIAGSGNSRGGLAGPAAASDYASAKAAGLIGEKVGGYVAVVGAGNAELRRIADDTNIKRKAVYSSKAQEQHVTIEEYAFATGCNLIAKTSPGEKYQAPDGSWKTRTSAPPVRDARCP